MVGRGVIVELGLGSVRESTWSGEGGIGAGAIGECSASVLMVDDVTDVDSTGLEGSSEGSVTEGSISCVVMLTEVGMEISAA